MGEFIEAIVVGIGSAAVLGLAYWALLILLRPALDRVRVALHGKVPHVHQPGTAASAETSKTVPRNAEISLAWAADAISRGPLEHKRSRIWPDLLPNIFDPFYTAKWPMEGTGLGLSIARAVVREHRGIIEAARAPAGGGSHGDLSTWNELLRQYGGVPSSLIQSAPHHAHLESWHEVFSLFHSSQPGLTMNFDDMFEGMAAKKRTPQSFQGKPTEVSLVVLGGQLQRPEWSKVADSQKREVEDSLAMFAGAGFAGRVVPSAIHSRG